MAVKLENTQKAEDLFGNWQETLIWSCLQKVMGEVYADDIDNPQSVMAVLGDFCFFAGTAKKELVSFRPEAFKNDFIIMVPQDELWAEMIREYYGERAKKVTRYAVKKEGNIFDLKKLQEAADSLDPGYEIKLIDQECFDLCRMNGWSADLVSQYEDYESYSELGLGAVILKNGELVSGASSYTRYRGGIEVEIDTKEEYRQKGLAYACGARLILECVKRGLYPSWDAQNQKSAALAEKLGYHLGDEYEAYEIWGYQ